MDTNTSISSSSVLGEGVGVAGKAPDEWDRLRSGTVSKFTCQKGKTAEILWCLSVINQKKKYTFWWFFFTGTQTGTTSFIGTYRIQKLKIQQRSDMSYLKGLMKQVVIWLFELPSYLVQLESSNIMLLRTTALHKKQIINNTYSRIDRLHHIISLKILWICKRKRVIGYTKGLTLWGNQINCCRI